MTHTISAYTSSGSRLAEITQYMALQYSLRLNDYGTAVLTIPATSSAWSALAQQDVRLTITRHVDGVPATTVASAQWFVRQASWQQNADGLQTITITAYSAAHLLARRIVAYAAGSAQADVAGAADDLIKQVIRDNYTSAATDSDRDLQLLDVDADTSDGAVIDAAFSRRNVLDVCQRLALASAAADVPVYFDVLYVSGNTFAARTWTGQPGADRRGVVLFAPERANLVDVALTYDWRRASNVIYAAGRGQGADRITYTATDDVRISSTLWSRLERYADARQADTPDAVQAVADAQLQASRPLQTLTGTLRDTPAARYGVHWQHGDRVTASINGVLFDAMIDHVAVTVQDGAEQVTAQLQATEVIA